MVVPRLLRVVIAAVATVTVVGACDEGSRQDRFCRRLGEEQGLLATVPTDPGELDDFVNRYRELAGIAPLAIEEQWQTITDLVEAVAIEDLEDPATADRLRDQAVAATRPVGEVRSYAQAVCGVDLLLIGAPATLPATTTAGTTTTLPAPVATTVPPTLAGTVPPTVP